MLNQNTSDFLNPVIYKELRQAFCGITAYKVILIAFAVLEILLASICIFSDSMLEDDLQNLCVIHLLFAAIAITASGLCVVANTARDRKVDGLEPLWGTRLTPLRIIRGKIDSALILNGITLACAVPFTIYLHDFLSWTSLVITIVVILAIQMASVAFACYRDGTLNTAQGWILVPVVTFLPAIAIAIGAIDGTPKRALYYNFVVPLLILVTVICGFACLAVSMLRHTRQNRMLPFRCFTLTAPFILLALLLICGASDYSEIISFWYVGVMTFSAALCVLATFEELLPTRRMRNEMPANIFIRLLVMPFQSGAPVAILNSLLMAALASLLLPYVHHSVPTVVCAIVSLSLFYSGIVILLRTWFKKIHAGVFWGIIVGFYSFVCMIDAVLGLDLKFFLGPLSGVLNDFQGVALHSLPFACIGMAILIWALLRYIVTSLRKHDDADI
jgi:hypothetical protein